MSRSDAERPPDLEDRSRGGAVESGEWRNWSGSLRFRPARVERPRDEAEVVRLVAAAAREGRRVRVVGAGHSSSGLMETEETLVSLERMQGMVDYDADAGEATIRAGTSIHDASRELLWAGLMMHNWGDVDVQTVVGAIATGTHGSGLRLPNLAWMLVGGRLVTGSGEVVEFSESDGDLLRSVRCGLGAVGVVTEARLRLQPAFRLQRQEWCLRTDDCIEQLDGLAERSKTIDFYWYPRSDLTKLRVGGEPGTLPRPDDARLVKDETGWGSDVVPQRRELRFEEMEYALPARAGLPVFQEVRRRVMDRHRRDVGWRVLWRYVAPDDAFLSEAEGRETVTISLHQNVGLPFWPYFHDMEPVFRRHVGRPHWGKKHTLAADDLRPLYPGWGRFQAERRRMDPDGTLLSPYMRTLLGVDA